jgi:hypothetical protein
MLWLFLLAFAGLPSLVLSLHTRTPSLPHSHLRTEQSLQVTPTNTTTTTTTTTTHSLTRSLNEKETVHIGVYNNIIGYLNWQEPWFATHAASKCATRCIFSLDRSAVSKADIVVFLASTFSRSRPAFPKRAKPTTVFVLHTMEQPMYATMLSDEKMLRKNFDLIATYNQVSVWCFSLTHSLTHLYILFLAH